MRQYEAVEIISNLLVQENLVEAIFIKGSLARSKEDEYSNIDLYCLVDKSKYDVFINKQISLLKKYDQIIYSKVVLSNISHCICVFDNGIVLNLYALKHEDLDYVDDMAIIFDPKGYLKDYKVIPLSYTPDEVGELLNKFLLTSIEFHNAYKRKDNLYSFSLASTMFRDLGVIIRIKDDPNYAKLGLKHLVLNEKTWVRYLEIASKLKLNSVLECVKMIYVFLDNYINNVPIALAEHINFDFYAYTKNKIMSII